MTGMAYYLARIARGNDVSRAVTIGELNYVHGFVSCGW